MNMRLFGLCLAASLLTVGCNQFASRAARRGQGVAASKPADYSASTRINLSFVAASKAPSPKLLARLQYKVDGTPAAPLKMELVDPKQPKGTVVKENGYTVHLNTFIGQPKVVNDRSHECLVQGAYTVCIVSDQGERIGEFEINPGGHLVYKGGTSDARIGVKMISTRDRTLYTVHHRSVEGIPGAAFLDIEFTPGSQRVERQTTASDGWNYRFDFWDGTLWLHPADHMGDMAEELEMAARTEAQNRSNGLAYSEASGAWIDGTSNSSFSGSCG
jgi:hypothetical protein